MKEEKCKHNIPAMLCSACQPLPKEINELSIYWKPSKHPELAKLIREPILINEFDETFPRLYKDAENFGLEDCTEEVRQWIAIYGDSRYKEGRIENIR
jgi:hypothetical protein